MAMAIGMIETRGLVALVWTTRATVPLNVSSWYGSAPRRTGEPTRTRAMSRSGTSICTLTVWMSWTVRMPTEAVLVPADCALTAAPESRLRWETYPEKGASSRVLPRLVSAS